jgi:MerR family mercuric resistance operon transcriptional regulator
MVQSQGGDVSNDLTIGIVAKRSGVNVETIRYYQRRHLLHKPSRPPDGYRHYSLDTVRRVRFIKRAQTLGFTLEEVGGLLGLDEKKACAETREIAAQKLRLIEEKISDLSRIKKALARLVRACDASPIGQPCPIINLLIQD